MGKWEGAKNALKTLPERVKKPMKYREFPMNGYKQRGAIVRRLNHIFVNLHIWYHIVELI